MSTQVNIDFSQLDKFSNRLRRFLPRWRRYHEESIQDLAKETYELVRQNASRRPGPEVRTGRYLGSIMRTDNRVFTNAPQAARLEYGFTGRDRLGRNYHQPPFPHWRPAIVVMRKQFPRQLKQVVVSVWRES